MTHTLAIFQVVAICVIAVIMLVGAFPWRGPRV